MTYYLQKKKISFFILMWKGILVKFNFCLDKDDMVRKAE